MDRKAGDTQGIRGGGGEWVLSFGASVQPRALVDICVTGGRMLEVSVFVAALV